MQVDLFPTWLTRKPQVPPLTFPFALRGRAVASAHAGMRIGTAPFVEPLEYDAAAAHAHRWQELAGRSLEANVFAEPACALATAQHFAGAHRPRFLFAWSGSVTGERGDLLAVCPMHVPGRLESRRLAWTWGQEHAPLATPLLDARRAKSALEAILAFVRQDTPPAAGMAFRGLPLDGPTAALLQTFARDRALACDLAAPRGAAPSRDDIGRGAMPLAGDVDSIVAAFGCRRHELERLGAVSFRIFRHPSDIRCATEEFFMLDAAARRARADAILSRSDTTTFVRALTRMLAATGKCRIDRLAIDDRPVAISILISASDRDYVWKIATDPGLPEFGLEGQLVLSHVRADPRGPVLALADSRPAPDRAGHGAGVWTRALPKVDVALAVASDRNREFAAAMRRSGVWRTARAALGNV